MMINVLVFVSLCCISHFGHAVARCTLEDLKSEWVGTTSASLKWSVSSKCEGIVRYEVLWEHEKYLACIDGENDPSNKGYGSQEVIERKTLISDLHPYSLYTIVLKSTRVDGSIVEPISYSF